MICNSKPFRIGTYILLGILVLICIVPFILLISSSFTSEETLALYGYRLGRSPHISERDIQSVLQSVLEKAAVDSPFSFLRTQTPRRLFVILLMSSTGEGSSCSDEQAQSLYHALCEALPQRLGLYVGKAIALADCREESHRIQACIENNINNEPGLYFTDREHPREDGSRGTLSDCVPRWKSLLAQGHRTMLLTEIQRYLERSGSSHSDSFRNLCDLHQQLTQIFFSFFYENKIEIRDLFTPEYSYQDYMDSFKNTELLWQGIHFMMDAIDRSQRKQGPQSEIEKAKCYIIENISRPILVTDVAEHVNLSTEYLTRLFKKETGRSIKAFITEAKVSAAKDLLANPNIPVSIVALELGYDNFSHFTQMFKKYEQLTPSEYRKKLLSAHED